MVTKPYNQAVLNSPRHGKTAAMKPLFTGMFVGLALAALILTNPYSKTQYVNTVSRRAHQSWCRHPEGEFCEMIAPLTRPLLQRLLYHSTRGQNYWIFSRFHTQVACYDIFAIGLGGQHIIWVVPDRDPPICQPLHASRQ